MEKNPQKVTGGGGKSAPPKPATTSDQKFVKIGLNHATHVYVIKNYIKIYKKRKKIYVQLFEKREALLHPA